MKIKTETISKILSYIVTVAVLIGIIYLGLWIIMGSSVLELGNIKLADLSVKQFVSILILVTLVITHLVISQYTDIYDSEEEEK